jgi:ubiquinone biosynthesis monooxygenase Coq6
MQRNLSKFYDIVIVGGGLVGNSMACSIGFIYLILPFSSNIVIGLAKNRYLSNKKILVLEAGARAKTPPSRQGEYSNRVSAISPSSVELLKGS